ncbi:uncharacterized protein LOC143182687 [Calliopsis andreniformis]|uniref:uncharacterized protein LOC143182687 n=1 Tax=Calliopsis andreniformis TaxID=337506 RepID=UPI003FCDA2A9
MTRCTKKKYQNQTRSNGSNLLNTVYFKRGENLRSNVKLFKYKDYLYGNKIQNGEEKVHNNLLHNGYGELRKNGNEIDSENKGAHQIVPVHCTKGLNNILKSTRQNSKLLNCELCTNSFSSKKSLEHHKKKTHANEIAIAKNSIQNGKQEKSTEEVLKCLREQHDIDKTLTNLVRIHETERVVQKNLQIGKMQPKGQETQVVRPRVHRKKSFRHMWTRKKTYKYDKELKKSVSYANECSEKNQMSFSDVYRKTFAHQTRLEHNIKKVRKENLIQLVEQRMTTRSITRRRTLEESLKNATFESSISRISETSTIKTTSSENKILNKPTENISEFMTEDCNSKKELNEVRHKTVVNHFFCDKMLNENHNNDNLTLNAISQEKRRSRRKSLKVETNGNVAQTALQTNFSMLLDSKLKSNYNISRQFEKEDKYEINKSIAIEKSTKTVCKEEHKMCNTFEKTRKSRYSRNSRINTVETQKNNIENKNVVEAKNHINNKKLVIPLIRVEQLSSPELSRLIKNSNYVESREKIQQEKVYQTSNTVQVQCSVHKQYRESKIKTNEKICMKNSIVQTCKSQRKSSSSYSGQEVGTHLKTIDLVSIHQYNEEKLEKNIEERSENILSEKTNKCTISPNSEINKTGTLKNGPFELKNNQLENIVSFFLEHKKNTKNKKLNKKAKKLQKAGIRRSVAVCAKCKQVFNLLLQFADKINFGKDEKLRIECTLCGLQIYSLSHFQQHIMDIHLQCEGISAATKKFQVNILHFTEHLHSNDNNKFIFECWCCLKVFDHLKDFQKHMEKVHQNFYYSVNEKHGENQVIQTSELFRTFDVTNDIGDTSEESKNSVLQTSDYIDEYYFNKKEINLKNSICYTDSNEVKHSSITHITQEISKSKTSVKSLNNENRYSDLNKISNISLTAESEILNLTNVKNNQKPKNGAFLYVCNVCPKTYKKRHSFLLHMSKHSTSSISNLNNELKIQDISKKDNIVNFENSAFVSNIQAENVQNHSNNCKDNSVLDSVPGDKSLEESICNVSASEESKELNLAKNENSEHQTEERITLGTNSAFDCNYLLHINFTQNSRRGIKRQKSIKFHINITKKCKTDDTEQQIVGNEIRNKYPLNYAVDTNFMLEKSKESRCNICDKKFNSPRVLKEHMFFLHDSIFEDTELSNLLTPYFHDLYHLETMSMQSINKFKQEYNVLCRRKMPGMLIERNKIHERAISKIIKKNNAIEKNRKWRCDPCKENFALIRNYLRHKYYYHNDESVVHICDNCNKVLTSVAMVNIHICTSVNSWSCKRCNLTFGNGISLTQHNISHHFETAGPHVCEVCKLNFLTTYMLQRHTFTHSAIADSSNISNSIDLSVKDNLSHNLNDTNNAEIENKIEEQTECVNDKDITCINKNVKDLNETNEAPKIQSEANTISNVISLPCDDDELFKCKLCNIICLTKIQMKVHLEKWHNIKVEMCQLCSDLYILEEITKHLIDRHVILDDSDFQEDTVNIQATNEKVKDFQNDIVRILGLKRLLSLYEYQRFDNVPENKCFNCVSCVQEFSNVQAYKIHYLKCHDTICLLCNIKFKHSHQAFVHKIKIHTSIDLYLWVIQKIITAILQFNKHGNTMEDVILRYSEIKAHDEEKHFANTKEHNPIEGFEVKISEYFWLRNYQPEKLDADKELLYAVEKFKSSAELSENVNTSIIIIDHSNYKHSSVLNNCELNTQNINKVLN